MDKPFFLGRTPVTLGQFRAFVRETGYKTDAEASGEGGHGFDPATHRFAGWKPEYTWHVS